MEKTAFITGITGQDGSYLAEFLLNKGYVVYGLVRRNSSLNTERIEHLIKKYSKEKKLQLVYGDLTDGNSLSQIIRNIKPDEVYNLGAQSDVHASFDSPESTTEIVALGTLRILEAIRNFNPSSKYFQASSSQIYGKTSETSKKEDSPFNPESPYACAKAYAHEITVNYREHHGLFACNGILFNHESPRRGKQFVTKKIIEGLTKIKHGLQENISLGNLEAKRDWGHARDYVEAMWRMLQQDKPDDYVLSTNETHSVREFLEESLKALKIEAESNGGKGLNEEYIRKEDGKAIIKINPKFYQPSKEDYLFGDSSKAREKLGWIPRTNFKELVEEMVEEEEKQIKRDFIIFKKKADLENSKKIKLMEDSIGQEEISAIYDCLKSGEYTQGKIVDEFEKKFAEWNGSKYAIMVNSGSSANLLIIAALKEKFNLKNGDEILVPSVTWPTTIYPIIQNGLVPVVCDVDESFNIDLDSIKKMVNEKTKAIFAVHLLGQPAKMNEIKNFCDENNLLLVEDCCESMGAKVNGKKIGNFGLMGSFSLYFGHHITTFEGGFITTDDFEIYDLLKSLRSHGWIRGTQKSQKYSHLKNQDYVFDVLGYNLRSTNLNASIGLAQLNKLDSFIERRLNNHKYFLEKIKDLPITPQKIDFDETSSFCFGIILQNRDKRDYLLEKLQEKEIECRPIVTGNLLRQPVFENLNLKKDSQLMADIIHDRGLYLPNNQFIGYEQIDYMIDTIKNLLNDISFEEPKDNFI